jgi:hypothetical protein
MVANWGTLLNPLFFHTRRMLIAAKALTRTIRSTPAGKAPNAVHRGMLVAAFCAMNFLIGCSLVWPMRHVMPWDLPNFYFAGQLLEQGHAAALYHPDAYTPLLSQLQRQQQDAAARHAIYFNRPAWEALLFAPLARLSYANAARVVIGVNALLIANLVWLLPKWFPSPWLTRPWLIAFLPFVYSLAYGQDTLLLTLLVGYALYLATHRHDVTAGIMLALASFKPHLIFLLPIAMIATRRWKMLGSFLSVGAALLLLSFAMVGREGFQEWFGLLRAPTTDFGVSGMGNLRGIALNFGTPAMIPFAVAGMTAFAVTLYRRQFLEAACASLLVALLLSPHTYMQDYSVLAVVAVAASPVALRYAVLIPWLYFLPGPGVLAFVTLNVASMFGLAASRPYLPNMGNQKRA